MFNLKYLLMGKALKEVQKTKTFKRAIKKVNRRTNNSSLLKKAGTLGLFALLNRSKFFRR